MDTTTSRRRHGRRGLRAGTVGLAALVAVLASGPAASGSAQDQDGALGTVTVGDVDVPVLATFSGRSTTPGPYDLVRGAVHGVQRIDGATVLYASVGFPEGGDKESFNAGYFFTDQGGRGYPARALPTMALVDREGLTSYWPLMTDRDTLFTTRETDLIYPAGELHVVWAVFPELPPTVTEVDVVIGNIEVTVPRIPVGDGALEPVVDEPAPVLGTGWPALPDADVIASADPALTTFDLLRRSESPGGEAATAESVDAVTATLDANVLFDKESAALTPAAQQVLATVAADIAQRGVGEVVVTGHTDADGSNAENQVLSEQRAASVVAALQPGAGSRVTFLAQGRGETEAVAPNDTPENKQLNRRVTVQYSITGSAS